jgi:hypothetical protein
VITAHAESLLQEATLAAVRADAGQVELRVVQGVPGRSLVEAARTVGADLLVLATRADGDMLCNAPCPVLLEPEHINRAVSGAVSGAAELCLGDGREIGAGPGRGPKDVRGCPVQPPLNVRPGCQRLSAWAGPWRAREDDHC